MTASSPEHLLTIGDISRRAGVPSSALRFYESRGLLSSVRTATGHRRYPRAVLRRIAFIVFAQKIGYTLNEVIAQLSGLPDDKHLTDADWRRLSRGWKARVEQRIAELQRLNMSLDDCIGCGCLSLKRCRLSNPDDVAGARGPGARRWLGDPKPTG